MEQQLIFVNIEDWTNYIAQLNQLSIRQKMRKSFQDAFADLRSLPNHRELLNVKPQSPQQSFLQVLLNLMLDSRKQNLGNLAQLLSDYSGSFSAFQLLSKYAVHAIEKQKTGDYQHLLILKMLSKWVEVMEGLNNKQDIRLYDCVIDSLERGLVTFEGFISYLNYISLDIVSILKSGSEASIKKYQDLSIHPHLDSNDLLKFIKVVLPKTISNIVVPRSFFPATLLKSSNEETVDILYSNQNLQNVIQSRPHYISMVKNVLKVLMTMELEPNQTKDLILSCFKYYYLFHHDKNHGASQLVIESLKKMTSAVRYAISDEILLFIIIIKKLGRELFVSYLNQKFSWMSELPQLDTIAGINKSAIKPFHSMAFNNSLQVKVEARKIEKRYVEIYDRFSLLYFCINCVEHDITIRFYYLGGFNKVESSDDRRLLFISDKKEGIFEGSIETIERGIYMFEFDNSYSWMKGKKLLYDSVVFVPLQIKENADNIVKSQIYGGGKFFQNQVPYENVIGWIDEEQIKLNSASANITYSVESNLKVYNVKMIKNSGQVYEFETDSRSRFWKKIKSMSEDPHVFWLIDGYKINNIIEVEKWLDGEFSPEKLQRSKSFEEKQVENQQKWEDTNSDRKIQRQWTNDEELVEANHKTEQKSSKEEEETSKSNLTQEEESGENKKKQEQPQIKSEENNQKDEAEKCLEKVQSNQEENKQEISD